MNQEQNDILGLNQQQSVETKPNQFSGVNFETVNAKSSFEQDSEQARNTGMENHIAGIPIVDSTIKVAKQKPDIQDKTISSSFTTRDEIMSKLNLMDENYNYTDTYTNYINHGGTPLPGYEWAHEELLNQERYDSIFQKVNDGTMSYDTALMEAYGKDIMATMGYDVTSVAYWQNKFLNNDFSNPFSNQYLMDQVKNAAEQYHQSRQTGEFSNRQAKDSQLSNLVNDELTAKQVRDIFGSNWDESIRDLEDEDLLRAVNTDSLAQSLRIVQDSTGMYYYLHNDGRLYKCDNQSGDGHATIELDENDQPKAIYVGGKGETHFNAFTSGFASVFTSITKFVGNGIGAIWELGTCIVDGDYDIDNATWWGQRQDAWLNKHANWAQSSGYIDLDEDFSWMDASHMGANLLGSVAGVLLLGNVMGAVGGAGETLSTSGKALQASGHAIKGTSKVWAGKALKATSTALKWQTGNFSSYASGMSRSGIWATRAGAAATYASKDFLNNIQQLNEQRMLLADPSKVDDGEIIGRAAIIAGINFGIDTLISGGIDDNTFQAYTGRNTLTKSATEELENVMAKYTSKQIATETIDDAVTNQALNRYLKSNNWVIRLNTTADLIGNFTTGVVSSHAQFDSEGELKDFSIEDFNPLKAQNMSLLIPAAFNSYMYSYRGQKAEYNLAFDNIKGIHSRVLSELDAEISRLSKPEDINALNQVRADYVKAFNESKKGTAEGKILDALNSLSTKIQSDPNEVPAFVQKVFKKELKSKKVEAYGKMYKATEDLYYARLYDANVMMKPETQNYFKIASFLKDKILNVKAKRAAATSTFKSELEIYEQMADYSGIAMLNPSFEAASKSLHTGVSDDEIKKVGEYTDYNTIIELKKKNEKAFNNIMKQGYTKEELETARFITINNAAKRTEDYEIADAAYRLARDTGLVELVDESTNTYAYKVLDPSQDMNMTSVLGEITTATIKLKKAQSETEYVTTMENLLRIVGVNKEDTPILTRTTTALTMLDSLVESKSIKKKQAAEIFENLRRSKVISGSDYDISKAKNVSAVKSYSKFHKYNEIFKALAIADGDPAKFKSVLNLGDTDTVKAVQELLKDTEISTDFKEEIKKITDSNYFQSGDTDGFQGYIKNAILNQFTDYGVSPEDLVDVGGETITKADIEKYLNVLAPEAPAKEKTAFINDLFNTWEKLYKGTTNVVTMKDNLVFLNINNLRGRYTNQLINDIELKGAAGWKDLDNLNSVQNKYQIAQELDTRSALINNNSQLVCIDINSETDRKLFNDIMSSLNYNLELKGNFIEDKNTLLTNSDIFGMSYNDGGMRVVKLPRSTNVSEVLYEAFNKGYIEIDGVRHNLGEVEYVDANGAKVSKPDVVTTLLTEIEVKNIDPSLNINLKSLPILELLPFNPQEIYTKDSVVTTMLKGLQELKLKKGKLASQSEKIYESTAIKAAATMAEQNPELANYFAVTMIIDHLYDEKAVLRINAKDLRELRRAGIVDGEGSFWESHSGRNKQYISLKDYNDTGRKAMKEFILSEDFNMYKILPMIGYNAENKEKILSHGYINQMDNLGVEMGDQAGGIRKTALSVLNIDFPWDNQERSFATKFFKDFLETSNTDHEFSPLKGTKLTQPEFDENGKLVQVNIKGFDKYYKSLEKATDPYSLLMKTYIDEFNKATKQKTDDKISDYDNWRLVAKNRKALQELYNATELTPEIRETIRGYFTPIADADYDGYQITGQRSTYTSAGTVQPGGTVLTGDSILANVLGGYDNIYYTGSDGIPWRPTDLDIDRAFQEIKQMATNIETDYATSAYKYITSRFIENDVSKLFTMAGASDGYIRIEDAEEIAQLISKNYNQVMEGLEDKFRLKSESEAVVKAMKVLFGDKAYKEAADVIFAQAKKNAALNSKFKAGSTSTKQTPLSTAPSRELTRQATVGTKEGRSLDTKNKLWDAYLAKEENKNKFGKWSKLASMTQNLNDYYNINKAYLDNKENIELFDVQHGNYSKAFQFARRQNAKGPQYTTILTQKKMLQDLKLAKDFDSSDEVTQRNLMETSRVLTDLFVGRDNYSGKYTKYVFIDNKGKIKDMNIFSAENLSDLFTKLVNNKAELKNSIIVTADPTKAGSTAALNVKYKHLSDDNEYSSFVTDLYHNWCIENEYQLKQALNVHDEESFMNIMGGISMDENKLKALVKEIPTYSMTEKEESKLIWQSVKDLGVDIDKKEFYKLLKYSLTQSDSFANATDRYNAAKKLNDSELGLEAEYDNLSALEKQKIDFITYGLDPESLTKEQRKALKAIKDSLRENVTNAEASYYVAEYFKGNKKVLNGLKDVASRNVEAKRDVLLSFLVEEGNASNVDVIARNRSLAAMDRERRSNKSSSTLVVSQKGDTLKTEDIRKMFDSMDNNVENKSKYTTYITYDSETSDNKANRYNKDYVFNVAFYIEKYVDGEWKTYELNYNLDHGDPKVWLANNVDMKSKNSFANTNAGYKASIDEFLNGKRTLPNDIKQELLSYIDDGKTLFVGQNSDEADIPWLRNAGILDDSVLNKVSTVDTLLIAKANLNDNRAHRSLKNTDLLEMLTEINNKDTAHGALEDAKATNAIFKELVKTDYNINKLRTKEIKNLEDFAESLGVKITKEDYKYLDMRLKEAREANADSDAFNTKYNITNDSVSIIKDAFNYQLKKDYSKLVFELRKLSNEDRSPMATKIITSGNFDSLFKVLSVARSKNISWDDILTSIKKSAKTDIITEDSIIETVGTKKGLDQIKQSLNITEEEINNYSGLSVKGIFEGDIRTSEVVDSNNLDMYHSLKGTYILGDAMQKAMDAIGIEDSSIQKLLTDKLLTFFDVDSSIDDPNKYLNSLKPNYIESKFDKAYTELLESRFGNLKALFNIPVNGKYSLITSFNTGDKVKDMLSGKTIVTDASMALVSKRYFESLMGIPFEEYTGDKELYSNMIIHPADGNNKVLARRLIVVDTGEDMSLKIPETVAETLGARDFDGDHVILVQPEARSQSLLKHYCGSIYKAHDVQEATLNWIKSNKLSYKDTEAKTQMRLVSRDEEVMKACVKADELLSQGKKIPKALTDEFIKAVKQTNAKVKVEDALKELWYTEFSTDFFEDKARVLGYIKNPAITLNKSFNASYSAKIKQEIDGLAQTKIDSYIPIDQSTGMIQKELIREMKPAEINRVYEDMIINNIYGADVVSGYLQNIKPEQASSFVSMLRDSIGATDSNASMKAISTTVNNLLAEIEESIKSNQINKTTVLYDILLREIEVNTRNYSANTLMRDYKSEDIKSLFTDQLELLKAKEKGIGLLNEIRNMKDSTPYMRDVNSDDKVNYVLNDSIQNMLDDNRIQYVDDFKDLDTVNTFVVVSGFPGARDEILANNKSSNPLHVYRSNKISFRPGDTIGKITEGNKQRLPQEGDVLPAGFTLLSSKGESKIVLKENAVVKHIDKKNKEIFLSVEDALDGQIKLVTNDGSKGPVNSSYSSDEDIDLIVNSDTLSPEKLFTSNNMKLENKLITKIIKDASGKEYEVTGYYSKGVVPTLVEDYKESTPKNNLVDILGDKNAYAIDHLHHCSDSKTIPGSTLMGGWYFTMKDGKLTYDPTRVQTMMNSLEYPGRRIQAHNYADAIQYTRMAYMINLLSDAEVAKEFNTKMSKNELLINKLSDIRVNSEDYNAMINRLIKKYGDRIDKSNTFINRLFDKQLYTLMLETVDTRTSGVNTDRSRSKNNLKGQQAVNEEGTSNIQRSLGRVDSYEGRDAGSKYRRAFDDIYINPLTALNYLFSDYGYTFSKSKLLDLTKRGLTNLAKFYPNANYSNRYRNSDMAYTQDRTMLELNHQPYGGSTKSATTQKPYFVNRFADIDIDCSETEQGYRIKHNSYINDNALADLIVTRKGGYNDNMLVAETLFNLGKIKPNMSAEERLGMFPNGNKLFTISQRLPYFGVTDDGIELNMTNTKYLTDTAKNLSSKINKTVKDFNYMYTVFKNKEDTDFDSMYDDLDTTKVAKRTSEYNTKQKEVDEVLNNIYKSLVNEETGEVDTTTKPQELVKDTSEADVDIPKVTFNKNAELVFERDPLLMSGSGLKEQGSPEAMNVGRAVKRMKTTATYISQEPLQNLTKLQKNLDNSLMSMKDFENFAKLNSLLKMKEMATNSKMDKAYKANLLAHNMTEADLATAQDQINTYHTKFPHVVAAYNNYIDSIVRLENTVRTETGEPLNCMAIYMSPYKHVNKDIRNANVLNTVHNMLNIESYSAANNVEAALTFDFFNSSKAIVKELSNMYGTIQIKNTLLDPELNLASNSDLIDRTTKMINDEILKGDLEIKHYTKEQQERLFEIQSMVLDTIEDYTKINTRSIHAKDIGPKYAAVYKQLDNDLSVMIDSFANDYNYTITSYSDAQKIMGTADSYEMRKSAEAIQNYYWAKMVCAQGIIESSPSFAKKFTDYIQSLAGEGKSLVNAMGQRYVRGESLKPLGSTSMANFADNIGIAYNSKDEGMWTQYMLEKIISGDIYVLDDKVVNYLNDNVYTRRNPSQVEKTFKEISKWSSAFQMALPSKLLNRLISFTGFDYSMASLYSPKTIGKMGKARRDLLAAYQSNGKSMDATLRRYMELEGQPVGLTGKDPVTFSEELNTAALGKNVENILNKMTDPLEFQNHLGRYAIYLAALESFEKGDPWYGPVYYKKDMIDTLPTNEDKAMYVMDYMLGSPDGGFPLLAKKTSGFMLYATFPLNFTRTLGAWGMSMAKLAGEGFTTNNGTQWMRTAVYPSVGLAGITALGAMITSLVCDLYGVEEEEKEEMLKKKVSIDPVGTLLGSTPTASSSAMNPLQNFEEMFITPFKDETYGKDADPSIWQKLFGFTNSNVISHLNPAIKTPIEIATGYDLYSAAPINTKYYYNGTENAIRKVLGFVIGSSTANAIVDQNKMDSYNENSTFLDTLITGIRRGVSNSIGNQKSYKKDTTNYYNNIYKVNNFKYANSTYQDAEVEDLVDADFLNTQRYYSSKYGDYSYDDYKRISNVIKKMVNNKAEAAEIYGVIADEYNDGVSEATLRTVLNNCSIIRKLKQVDTSKYISTLSAKEYQALLNAIEYEERMYPMLDEFFPDKETTSKTYLPKRTKYYGGGRSNYYPTYSPRRYYPSFVYPTSSSSYNKYKSYRPYANIDRVSVRVSPEMAVWKNDYNAIDDLEKKEWYLDNPFYNSLSDYEKRQKGGN